MTTENMPVLTPEGGLSRYLQEIRKFPMLEAQEEYMLGKRFREHDDLKAAHKLVTSHLRLVAKIAMGYRGYGLPIGEVISEGNVGLMKAVKRFDPDKGFRLATYAMWWIKASIQEYVLRSWSLVKLGTTAAQKKLFFNLRRTKGQIEAMEEGDLLPEHVTEIADRLGVGEEDVISMNRRLGGSDNSLNARMKNEMDGEWQDWLTDDTPDQEVMLSDREEFAHRQEMLTSAMKKLNEREMRILTERRLKDPPATLEELGQYYNISRERIRQIELRAFEKVRHAVQEEAMQEEVHISS
ncbi:MAG: RNA polymerase sigma factor RpoH [Parvularculales bacterium]